MSKLFNLTPRELEVLKLYKTGKTSKDIALLFGRSIRTIGEHNRRLRAKLNDSKNIRTALFVAEKYKILD